MDTTSQSILETLRTVEFRLGLKGYNVDEVDEYLEKAAVEAESVTDQVRTLNERLRAANDRIAQLESERQGAPPERAPETPAPVADDALQRTLVLAQRFVEQTRRESEAEASELVRRAEERARTVVADAEDRARQIVAESEEHLREEVERLESARTRLSGEVDALATQLEHQRTRIRESLTEALKWFDDRLPSARPQDGDGAPAGTENGRPQSADRRQGPSRPGPGGSSSQPATIMTGGSNSTPSAPPVAVASDGSTGAGGTAGAAALSARGSSPAPELFRRNGAAE